MTSNLDYSNAGTSAGPQPPNTALPGSAASSGDYASTVLIEELGAPSGNQPRTVTLQGPSLPFMGTKWGGKNALFTTWLPGNGDEATQHDLGPQEVPKEWQGEWKRTMMGKAPTYATDQNGGQLVIVDPEALVELLEDIYRGGQRLRVTWTVSSAGNPSANGKKVREGRAREWEFNYTRIQDIAWSVTFEWQSRGTRAQAAASVRDGSLDAAAARVNVLQSQLASAVADADFIASNAAIYKSATSLTLGQLENMASAPSVLVNGVGRNIEQFQSKLSQLAGIATTLASQPVAVANAAVNIAKNAIAAGNQFVDSLGQIPLETMSLKSSVKDLMRSFRYFGTVSDTSYQATLASQQLVEQIQARTLSAPLTGSITPQSASVAQDDLLAVYVTKDGDTPASVSLHFYGTMDHGLDILQANRMPWHQAGFTKGRPLIIPRLKSSQRGA
jgi:hypothetical protein